MTAKLYLSLVLHNHQPVGQFDFVNEHCVKVAYEPFVTLMEQRPAIKCGIHFTGSLLDYLVAQQKPLLNRIRALVERGQLEVLAGAYYEPILTTLPDADKIGQIQKLSRAVEDVFGMKPRGMWLAERVWEPHLVRPIAEAGIDYVIIDDTHFEAVGYNKEKELFGYFVSEEQGYTVRVFPTLSYLRYAIPWDTVPNLVTWLRQQADTPTTGAQPKLAFMGDDGEKFGVWPGTYDHNWGESRYMARLFQAIEENGSWLETIRPMDYIDQYPALGRVYLPTASYFEMGQWALPANRFHELKRIKKELTDQNREDVLRYVRGSVWRNFMIKYDEVNHMNKRMLHVAEKVHAMPDGPDKTQALDHLWRAQANDAYWHGLFGGIYLFNFRVANYANLIAAETLAEGQNAPITVKHFDFNKDSTKEIVLCGHPLNAIWKPNLGGMMLELDSRPLRYNVLNLMTRYEEGYHDEIREGAGKGTLVTPEALAKLNEWEARDKIRVKEAGIERGLIYDWHRRGAFLDHFLREDVDIMSFYRAFYGEQGDFVNLPYQPDIQAGPKEATVTLSRDGHVWVGDRHIPVRVVKAFTFRHGEEQFTCTYTLINQSGLPINLRFGVELASGFDGGPDMQYCHLTINGGADRFSLAEIREYGRVTTYSSFTNLRGVELATAADQPFTLWVFPLETVTNSEAGYERGYQGTVYLHTWNLHLEPNAQWQTGLTQRVSAYKP
jgi:alpha-amylase